MVKKVVCIGVAFIMLFSLAGCSGLPVVSAVCDGDSYGTYKPLGSIVMNAGETLTINSSNFDGVDSNVRSDWTVGKFDRFELFVENESHEGVVTIKNNIITAANSGYTRITAEVYIRGKNPDGQKVMLKWTVFVAEIHVINEATMTHITTAQELADMKNNLDGHYILKADIDLADEGEWEPIGKNSRTNEFSQSFRGMFVNDGSYKIENLTINKIIEQDEDMILLSAGFFGDISDAFICGIILENVNIRVLGETCGESRIVRTVVGSIAGISNKSIILDCAVNGNLTGNYDVGGIVGIAEFTDITNCSVDGNVEVIWDTADSCAGGIVGFNYCYLLFPIYQGVIKNCRVNANINGHQTAIVGGIIGEANGFLDFDIINSTFEGELSGLHTGIFRGRDAD